MRLLTWSERRPTRSGNQAEERETIAAFGQRDPSIARCQSMGQVGQSARAETQYKLRHGTTDMGVVPVPNTEWARRPFKRCARASAKTSLSVSASSCGLVQKLPAWKK